MLVIKIIDYLRLKNIILIKIIYSFCCGFNKLVRLKVSSFVLPLFDKLCNKLVTKQLMKFNIFSLFKAHFCIKIYLFLFQFTTLKINKIGKFVPYVNLLFTIILTVPVVAAVLEPSTFG